MKPGTHEQLGAGVGRLVDLKDPAYGQGTAVVPQVMALFYPTGIPVEKFTDAALIIRVLDKLCRISRGNKGAFDENPWKDIAGYALRAMEMDGK